MQQQSCARLEVRHACGVGPSASARARSTWQGLQTEACPHQALGGPACPSWPLLLPQGRGHVSAPLARCRPVLIHAGNHCWPAFCAVQLANCLKQTNANTGCEVEAAHMSLHHGDLHIGVCRILRLQWRQEYSNKLSHELASKWGIKCSHSDVTPVVASAHRSDMEQCDSEISYESPPGAGLTSPPQT